MNFYVSQQNVENAVEYFKTAGFDSDDMLFLFLMSKHLGVTTSYPVSGVSLSHSLSSVQIRVPHRSQTTVSVR